MRSRLSDASKGATVPRREMNCQTAYSMRAASTITSTMFMARTIMGAASAAHHKNLPFRFRSEAVIEAGPFGSIPIPRVRVR